MEILATFDGSKCSEAILPQLEWLARVPDARFTFLSFMRRPDETPRIEATRESARMQALGAAAMVARIAEPVLAEDRGEAIERTLAERNDYLKSIVARCRRGRSTPWRRPSPTM